MPGELAIIGGGVIGLEMANYYCAAGSKVTVIEMLDHIGGNVDRDISKNLQLSLEKIGVKFLLSSKVTKISGRQVTFEKNGKEQAIKADKVLLSIGRKPFTEGIGLENIGVYTERGG